MKEFAKELGKAIIIAWIAIPASFFGMGVTARLIDRYSKKKSK